MAVTVCVGWVRDGHLDYHTVALMTCSRGTFVLLAYCIAIIWSTFVTADRSTRRIIIPRTKYDLLNPVFDHEALLGARVREELAELPSYVRIDRLITLAKSHDDNNSGFIEVNELMEWIIESYKIMDREEARVKFKSEDVNGDGKVSLSEIMQKRYGLPEDGATDMHKNEQEEKNASISRIIMSDKNRFADADIDNDNLLDEIEYAAFYHPHYFPYMYGPENRRVMKELDTDQSGYVSLEEFIKGKDFNDEVRQFDETTFENLDENKNGQLSPMEIRYWVLPGYGEVAADEADNLIKICDRDNDGRLSVDEIVMREENFIESTATVYGRSLHFVRDEL